MDKQVARKQGLAARKALSPEVRMEKDRAIYEAVLPYLRKYPLIGCYISVRDGVSTRDILRYCGDHAIPVCVPKVVHKTLVFYLYPSELKVSKFGIPEPVGGKVIPVEQIGCMFVPLSSFDPDHNRTGYGAGYYDSVLGKCPLKIGLAYREQMVEKIDTDPWDVLLDDVIYR